MLEHLQNFLLAEVTSNRDWWPNSLNLKILSQHSSLVDPMDKKFNYAKEFKKLNFKALKKDLHKLMTDYKIGGLLIMVIMEDFYSANMACSRDIQNW